MTAEDFVISTQEPSAQHLKGKGRKLVSSYNQCSLEESFNLLSQDKLMKDISIEEIFYFLLDMNHIRPPIHGFTSQRVLNIEQIKIYKALRDKYIVDSSRITLRPIFYKNPNEGTSEPK